MDERKPTLNYKTPPEPSPKPLTVILAAILGLFLGVGAVAVVVVAFLAVFWYLIARHAHS